jgi:lysylphosphatidylglycerol synthetase-like protein (DUF2156 family)
MTEINEVEKKTSVEYGSVASEAMFDFPCIFFKMPECIGFIAYRVEHHCAIVFGEAICPPEETSKLTDAFHLHCKELNLNVIYVIVSEKFAREMVANKHSNILIEVCDELIIDPQLDPYHNNNRLRHRVEKGVKKGLTFHEYIPSDSEIEKTIKQIGIQWQDAIKGPHIYLGHLDFFESYIGKRWFYVKEDGKITGMVMLSKIGSRDGWLLKFLITAPDAFQYTSEFLMTSLLTTLKNEGCKYLTKGMVPIDSLGEIKGLGNLSTGITKSIYNIVSRIYKFKTRKEYWQRYRPQIQPVYMLFSRPHLGVNEIRALIKIFKTSHHVIR